MTGSDEMISTLRDFRTVDEAPCAALREAGARHLGAASSRVRWTRFGNSRANKVYRGRSRTRSVIVKVSDNVAVKTGWSIPANHLRIEYRFLELMHTVSTSTPEPLAFCDEQNAFLMSDLGKTKHLILDGFPRWTKPASSFRWVGRNLATMHQYEYPAEFVDNLNEREIAERLFRLKFDPPLFDSWDPVEEFLNRAPRGIVLMDASPRNTLFTGTQLYLIDFDFLACGDQSFDLAHYLHFVLWRALMANQPRTAFAAEALVEEYALRRGVPPDSFYADEGWRRWLYALLFQKLTPGRRQERVALWKEVLQRCAAESPQSWRELTASLFTARQEVVARSPQVSQRGLAT